MLLPRLLPRFLPPRWYRDSWGTTSSKQRSTWVCKSEQRTDVRDLTALSLGFTGGAYPHKMGCIMNLYTQFSQSFWDFYTGRVRSVVGFLPLSFIRLLYPFHAVETGPRDFRRPISETLWSDSTPTIRNSVWLDVISSPSSHGSTINFILFFPSASVKRVCWTRGPTRLWWENLISFISTSRGVYDPWRSPRVHLYL